jgi:hypothetical protein
LLFLGLKYLKFFDEDPGSGIRDGDSSDPGSGMEKSLVRDPGWKKVWSGIRDKHPGSATLLIDKDELSKMLRIFSFIKTLLSTNYNGCGSGSGLFLEAGS